MILPLEVLLELLPLLSGISAVYLELSRPSIEFHDPTGNYNNSTANKMVPDKICNNYTVGKNADVGNTMYALLWTAPCHLCLSTWNAHVSALCGPPAMFKSV